MKILTYASLVLLTGAALVLVAQPTAACGPPTSGTGLSTCNGTASTYEPTTTDGPVCWNALCPGVEQTTIPGTCADVWAGGQRLTLPICVPVSL
jgi:hypothetical protein